MAKVWRKESIEEMEHADKFTDRILFLDGFPNMQVLDPLRIGQNVKEIIECDLAAEVAARASSTRRRRPTATASRTTSRATCSRSLMKDEEHHIDFLETQLDLIGRIGLELYTQKHIGGLESEGHEFVGRNKLGVVPRRRGPIPRKLSIGHACRRLAQQHLLVVMGRRPMRSRTR